MKFITFIFGLLVCLSIGCGESVDGIAFNSDNYEIEDIADSKFKRASKYAGDIISEQGTLLNGMKEGTWVTYYDKIEGKIRKIEHFHQGKIHGASIIMTPRGHIQQIAHYIHGQQDGMTISYNNVKTAGIANYSAGQLHGIFKGYFDNGMIQQTVEYKNGLKDGKLKYFDEEGNMTLEYTYKDDEKVE